MSGNPFALDEVVFGETPTAEEALRRRFASVKDEALWTGTISKPERVQGAYPSELFEPADNFDLLSLSMRTLGEMQMRKTRMLPLTGYLFCQKDPWSGELGDCLYRAAFTDLAAISRSAPQKLFATCLRVTGYLGHARAIALIGEAYAHDEVHDDDGTVVARSKRRDVLAVRIEAQSGVRRFQIPLTRYSGRGLVLGAVAEVEEPDGDIFSDLLFKHKNKGNRYGH